MDKNFKTRNGKYSESNKTFKKDKNAIKKINEKIILENSKGSKYMSGQLCQIIKNGEIAGLLNFHSTYFFDIHSLYF